MLPFMEVRVLDINSEHLGVGMDALMDNAGEAVAEAVLHELGTGKRIVVVCGVGNNAGDGFVAARNLMRHNDVTVLLANPPGDIRTAAAQRAYDKVKHVSSSSVGVRFSDFDVVVDALLGTGSREVREPYRTLIERINDSGAVIVSVDVPSGLGSDVQVRPSLTVTFTQAKEGMTSENSGKILVRDIGVPPDAARYVGPGEFVHYPRRRPDSHKGQNGRVLVVGGGPFTGAPALAGLAAYRSGVDLVHIATPAPTYSAIASYSPNFIVHRLPHDLLSPDDSAAVSELEAIADCMLIGPGLGTGDGVAEAVREIVRNARVPLVIDADAITAIGGTDALNGKTAVITPHAREFERLTGAKLPKAMPDRTAAAEEAASDLGATLIVKGPIDIITDGKWTKLNRTGNPYMSVGGTGDVLAGMTAGLLSMGAAPFEAARMAAYLNGRAGDHAAERYGPGMMATDVIDEVPRSLLRCIKAAGQ